MFNNLQQCYGAARIATVKDNFRIESLHLWPVASLLLEMWAKEIHNGACAICYTRADTNLLKQARSAKGEQGTSYLSHIQIFKMPNLYLIWPPYTKFQTVVECNCWKYFQTCVNFPSLQRWWIDPESTQEWNTQNLLCGTAAKLDFASLSNQKGILSSSLHLGIAFNNVWKHFDQCIQTHQEIFINCILIIENMGKVH